MPHDKRQAEKKRSVIEAFRRDGGLAPALKAAGVKPRTHYQWLENDAGYAAAFAEAKRQVLEEKQGAFLAAYRRTGSVEKAAAAADIHKDMHKRWLEGDQYTARVAEIRRERADHKKEALLKSYLQGADLLTACQAAGVTPATHYQWLCHDAEYAACLIKQQQEQRREQRAGGDLTKQLTEWGKISLCWTCLRCGWDCLCQWPEDKNTEGKKLRRVIVDGEVAYQVLDCRDYWPDEAALARGTLIDDNEGAAAGEQGS